MNPVYCPICGNDSVPSRLSSETNIFQCFLNLFYADWKGKTFSFCELCRSHLLLVSDLQKKLEVLENKIKSHEKELQAKFSSSEARFEKRKLYEKDGRYLRLRKFIRTKVSLPEPEPDSIFSDDDDYQEELEEHEPDEPFQVANIKVEVEDGPLNTSSPHFDDEADNQQDVDLEDDQPDSINEDDEEMMEEDTKSPPESPTSSASEAEDDDDDDDYIPSDSNQDNCEVEKNEMRSSRGPKFKRSEDGMVVTIHNIRLIKTSPSLGEESYRCSECDVLLPDKRHMLRSHVIREHTTLHACPHCPKRFDKTSKVLRHVNQIHKRTVIQTCDICARPFNRTGPIDDHMWTHYSAEEKAQRVAKGEKIPIPKVSKKLQCDRCEEEFPGIISLKRHVKEVHLPEKSLCGVCGKEIRDLRRHMKLRHTAPEEMNFQCEFCSKKFTLGGQLQQHLKVAHVTGNPWKCEVCGKEYKLEKYLKEHMGGHADVKPFSCHVCGVGFSRKNVMQRHILTVHEGKRRLRKPKNYADVNGKQWKCEVCEKEFKLESYLKEHMVGHADVKPFSCHICGTGFSRRSGINQHIRNIHEGKPRLDKKVK